MENKKVTRKDLTVVKGKIEVDTLIIDNKKINLTPTPNANIEQFITHKDWEPSAELMAKFKEFNEFLVKQSTNTWMPSNKRINISEYL